MAFAASAPGGGRPSTIIGPANNSVVVARVDQISFDVEPDIETDLSSALGQLRVSRGTEFWSLVTAAAEVVRR